MTDKGAKLEGFIELELEDSRVLIPRRADMKKLYIELSSRCNMDCPLCFRRFWSDSSGDMDFSLFEKIAAQLRDFPDLEYVHLAGFGEPLVHPHFFDALRLLKSQGLNVRITSNGRLITPETAHMMVECGLDELDISIEPMEDEGAGLREGSVAASMEAIRLVDRAKKELGRDKPKLNAAVVLSRASAKAVLGLPKLISGAGCHTLSLSNLIPTSKEAENLSLYPLTKEEEDRYLTRLYLECHRLGVKYIIPRFRVETERRCAFANTYSTVLRWDGEICPCYRLLHSYPEWVMGREKRVTAYSFGNANEKSLMDIWNADKYLCFRWRLRRAIYASCLDCQLLDVCEYPVDTVADCWGDEPACGDCLWDRRIILCP